MESKLAFRSFDGTELEGTFADGQRAAVPVAILVHGITSSRDELGLFSGLASYLAGKGMSSLRFDYRCHGGSNLPIERMTLSGIVNDIESAALAGLAKAAASSVSVIGMSFGGGLAAFWAGTTSVAVSSVVMLAPVIDN